MTHQKFLTFILLTLFVTLLGFNSIHCQVKTPIKGDSLTVFEYKTIHNYLSELRMRRSLMSIDSNNILMYKSVIAKKDSQIELFKEREKNFNTIIEGLENSKRPWYDSFVVGLGTSSLIFFLITLLIK